MEQDLKLGELVRGRRIRDLDVTMKEIADRMNVTPMYVSDIERGKRTPLKIERLRMIAQAYDLPSSRSVETAALISNESVQIGSADDWPVKRRLAVTLARQWSDLTPDRNPTASCRNR